MDVLAQFFPIIAIQALYAIFTYKVAAKTGKNRALYVVVTLIPGIGSIFFVVIVLSSILYCLDKIDGKH